MKTRTHIAVLSGLSLATLVMAMHSVAQETAPLPPVAAPEVSLPSMPPPLPPLATPTDPSVPPVPPQAPGLPELPPMALPTNASPSPVPPPAAPGALPPGSNALSPVPPSAGMPSPALGALPPADAAAAVPGQAPALPPAPKDYSFGSSSLSILFLPNQVEQMKSAIRTFEDIDPGAQPQQQVDIPVAPSVQAPAEPDRYPVFFLSSIVYETPSEWSLWLSGHKITSRQNETDVTVVSLTKDSATFLWKPSFVEALMRRYSTQAFAPVDGVKNKLTVAQSVNFDPKTSVFTFTLKSNQSFSPGYFSTFEGYIDSPALPALDTNGQDGFTDLMNGVFPPSNP